MTGLHIKYCKDNKKKDRHKTVTKLAKNCLLTKPTNQKKLKQNRSSFDSYTIIK